MKQKIVLEYKPNERQAEFHKSGEDYVVYGGARGGGKTCALVWEAFMWGLEHPGANMFIFRETFTMLEANVILEWKNSIPEALYKYNESKHIAKLANGTQINFAFVNNEDDARKYQGANIDWIGVDELTKHTEKEIQLLLTCLRSAKGFKPKFRGTCNPGGVGHLWVKEEYILPTEYGKKVITDPIYGVTKKFIPATVYDNEVLMRNDPNYVRRLENLPENEKQAFLYGNWDIFEGRFFGEWKEETHVIKPFEIPREWKKYVSIDWGYNDYTDVLWHATNGKHIYTYRELHVKETSVRDVAHMIKQLMNYDEKPVLWVGSPDMWQTRGMGDKNHGANIAEVFAQEGIYWTKADNSRIIGWQVMREYMLNTDDETPRWQVFSTCANIIRCLPLAQYDDKKLEDMATEPHEITDALDSARYFLMTRPSARQIKERIDTTNYTPTEIVDYLGGKIEKERKHDSVDRRRVWKS